MKNILFYACSNTNIIGEIVPDSMNYKSHDNPYRFKLIRNFNHRIISNTIYQQSSYHINRLRRISAYELRNMYGMSDINNIDIDSLSLSVYQDYTLNSWREK